VNTWTEKNYSLNDYLGEPFVLIRFRFQSDAWVVMDGMYIDDFEIDVEYFTTTGTSGQLAGTPEITVSPNPVVHQANIGILAEYGSDLTITLYSNLGEKVRTIAETRIEPGEHNFLFLTGNLPQGVYYLVVKHDRSNSVKKLIISK
jgi:hypothetical protein